MAFAPHSSKSAARHDALARGALGFLGSPSVAAQLRLCAHLNARAAERLAPHQLLAESQLPSNLSNGVKSLSGVATAGVKVHYNSAKPAQLNAEAYAQGRDIHLAPGKTRHLPHEAWHVAQQALGRVKPTMQLQETVPVNDDKRLEKEADAMGKKAATLGSVAQRKVPTSPNEKKPIAETVQYNPQGAGVVFNQKKHPRSKLAFNTGRKNFSSGTRAVVFARHHPQYIGEALESVRVVTGTQENVKGVQLDHRISWHDIARVMSIRNSKIKSKDADNSDEWYSLRDARLYYNDISNLQPVLASDNAASGARGVRRRVEIHDNLAGGVAQTHNQWMHLQRNINRLGENPDPVFRQNVEARLVATRDAMAAVSTEIAQHIDRPVVGNAGDGIVTE